MKKLDENLIKRIKEQAITYSERLNSDFIDKLNCNIDIALSYRRILEQLRYDFDDLDNLCMIGKIFISSTDDNAVAVVFDDLRYRYNYGLNVENGYYKIKGLLDAIDFICHLERYERHELFIIDYLLYVVGASRVARNVDGSALFTAHYFINDKNYYLKVELDYNNFINKIYVLNEQDKKVNITKALKEIAITISHLKDVEKARENNNALRYYRIVNGLTMEELATKAGLTKTFIYLLESNRQDIETISFDKIIRLAKVLKVNPLDLTRYGVDS